MKSATAFAPATVANVAVGFDILGFALANLGEWATVTKISKSQGVVLEPIENYPELSLNPEKNTATAGLVRLVQEKNLNFGFKVRLYKRIPIGSGLGGSSTSAVAALIAANALLPKKLRPQELLDFALTGEMVASGSRHADNIGPCLTGGLVFSDPKTLQIHSIKIPRELRCVVLLPKMSIKTEQARKILSDQVPLSKMVQQTSGLAGFLLGCMQSNFALIQSSLQDVVIEPQRSQLIPGFAKLKAAALEAGALGFSLSGSGPAMFALTKGIGNALRVQKKLLRTSEALTMPVHNCWVLKLSTKGAHLVKRVDPQ